MRKQLPSLYERFENFTLKFIWVLTALLAPLLIWDSINEVPSQTELYWIAIILPLSIVGTVLLVRRVDESKAIKDEISNGLVEVLHVKTQRAIKREDPDDFGIAFYLDVIHDSTNKTLYLWGQYLDDLEYENQFPNTEFEIVIAVSNKETMDINLLGQQFKPEKVLEPFKKEIWKKGVFPFNGQLLNMSIDEVT